MSMNHLGNIKPWFNDSSQVLLNYEFNILDIFLHSFGASETPETGREPQKQQCDCKGAKAGKVPHLSDLASHASSRNNENKWEWWENAIGIALNHYCTVCMTRRVHAQDPDGPGFKTWIHLHHLCDGQEGSVFWASVVLSIKMGYQSLPQGVVMGSNETITVQCLAQCLVWFRCWVMSNSCDPMGCSSPGSSVQVTSQARILEWVAISFSRGSYWHRDQTLVSCIAGEFFTDWATGKPIYIYKIIY